MKPFAIVLLIALFLQSCGNNGKTKNEATHDAGEQKAIKAEESFDTSRKIGVGGKISYQWKKSDSLCAHASTKELIALAKNHSDKIQRLIAFRALLMKDSHEAVNLAISEIEDTTEVPVSDGCCGSNDIVSGVRIEMIQYNREGYKVSVADSMRIDSAVLFSNHASKFDYIYHLYHKLPARPEYEERLEQLYKHDLYALIALARYHREDTKQDIIRLLSQMDKKDFWNYRDTIRTALDAVIAWPSASYKQQVRHVCQDLLNKPELYGSGSSILGALMAYNDRWSYNLIDKTLSKAKQKNQNYFDYSWGLYEAYNDNPLPLFKPLYKKYAIEE
jgi:hypothetical protein